jgi:transposase-like protein
MRFSPSFCPHPRCVFNRLPAPGFAARHGRYYCRARDCFIPRFRCSGCTRTFSYATFRFSYRQKKPHLDAAVMRLLCSGVSLRGAARLLEVNRKTVVRKLARLGRHSRQLHRAVLKTASLTGSFQLDEMESFESNRFQPVTVPVLIEKKSYFILDTSTAPMRRKGRMTPKQKKMRAEYEALHGRRPTGSDQAVSQCLRTLALHAASPVVLESDRKASYGRIGRRLLGARLVHRTHHSRARRDRANALFAINHTNAMLRYCLARLRRRTWCVSRNRRWLELALSMYTGWFNYCRGITIKTRVSPAQALGLARAKLAIADWLGWRQDWPNAGRILPVSLRINPA